MPSRFDEEAIFTTTFAVEGSRTFFVSNKSMENSFVLETTFPFLRTTTKCLPFGEKWATRPFEGYPLKYSWSAHLVVSIASTTVTNRFPEESGFRSALKRGPNPNIVATKESL